MLVLFEIGRHANQYLIKAKYIRSNVVTFKSY